jgi:hypothetical protein
MKVDAYTPAKPIVVTIEFDNREEAEELMADLTRWKPTQGWQGNTKVFFIELERAISDATQ